MALLNGAYLFVESETVDRGVDVTSHPVESGIDITDNVKRKAITISVSGKIVKAGKKSAATILSEVSRYHSEGKFVRYVGRNIFPQALITSFSTEHTADIYGGCSFSLTLQEVRIAQSAYKAAAKSTTTMKQATTKKAANSPRYYTVKTGDCLWSIARKYYGNGAQYPKIYNANKAMIDKRNKGYNVDKYTIYTGQKFIIPY